MFSNDFTPKKPLDFVCEKCDFITSNKKDYSRHLQTKKHFSNDFQCKIPQKTPYSFVIVEKHINILLRYVLIKKNVPQIMIQMKKNKIIK